MDKPICYIPISLQFKKQKLIDAVAKTLHDNNLFDKEKDWIEICRLYKWQGVIDEVPNFVTIITKSR